MLIGAGTVMLLTSGKKDATTETEVEATADGSDAGSTRQSRRRARRRNAWQRIAWPGSPRAKETTVGAVRSGRDTLSEAFRNNPLLVGAVVAGIGAAASLLLPLTEWERNMVGDASDRTKAKAVEAIETVAQEAQEVAQHGLHTAKDEAHTRGLLL